MGGLVASYFTAFCEGRVLGVRIHGLFRPWPISGANRDLGGFGSADSFDRGHLRCQS